MRRLLLLAFASLSLAMPFRAHAAASLTGSTSCDLQGRFDFRPYLPFVMTANGKSVRVQTKVDTLACDGSAVSGGALGGARIVLHAKLPAGTDCSSFLSTIGFEKSTLTVQWRGLREGRLVPLGKSKTSIASASFDQGSGAFVIVTEPIAKGSFAGSTMTMRLDLGDIGQYTDSCNTWDAGYTAFVFGPPLNDNTWTLSVP